MNKPVHTISDIARLAGVSKSTVSRALDDSPLIAVETKDRIRAIAREHNFQRNAPARRLSLRQSHAIALATPPYKGDSAVPDAFMLEMMSGITAALHASDHDLLVVNAGHGDVDWVRRYVEGGRVDGFILLTAMCTQEQLDTLIGTRTPFVAWGPPPADRSYCTVGGDSVAGGRVATAHMLERGRRRIAFLGGPARSLEVQERLAGYRAAHETASVEVDPGLVVHVPWQPAERSAAAGLDRLLDHAPDLDGVFAISDAIALAAIDVLTAGGRRVPDDVAVVGYDDIAVARHATPPLTTVRQTGALAGRLLAQSLLEFLRSGVVTNVTIPAELVVRGST